MVVRVRVLFTPGCEHAAGTCELICSVAREQEIHLQLEEDLVRDPVAAVTAGFRGSPTVLVEGVDLEPWTHDDDAEVAGFG